MPNAASPWTLARWLVWAVVLLGALYALAGFVIAPRLLQSNIGPMLSRQLGGEWHLARLDINPFDLSLEVRKLAVKDPAGKSLAAVERLRIDLDAVDSLRRRAVVLDASLQGLDLNLELDRHGARNFGPFFSSGASTSKPSAPMPPVRIKRLTVQAGRVKFSDRSQTEAFSAELAPLTLSLDGLSGQKGDAAPFNLQASGTDGMKLRAQGRLMLVPLDITADVELDEFPLTRLKPYLEPLTPLEVTDGRLLLRFHAELDGGVGLPQISAGRAALTALSLAAGGKPAAQAKSLEVEGIDFNPGAQELTANAISLRKLRLAMPLSQSSCPDLPGSIDSIDATDARISLKNRLVSLRQIRSNSASLSACQTSKGQFVAPGIPPRQPSAVPEHNAQSPVAWRVRIDSLGLSDYRMHILDQTVSPPLELNLDPIHLEASEFHHDTETELQLKLETGLGSRGWAEAEGSLILRPNVVADLRIAVERLGIRRFQPYVTKLSGIQIYKGKLDLAGNLDYYAGPVDSFRFSGDAELTGIAATEKRNGKELFNWQGLKLNGLIFETTPRRLSIREVIAMEPYANFVLDPKGKLNVSEALSPRSNSGAQAGSGNATGGPAWAVAIGSLRVTKGHANFTDIGLKPVSFTLGVHELRGNVRGLSSQKDAKADVLLEGKIEHNAPARISGQINPFRLSAFTDISLEFQGVDLTTLSPYSGKFAGYRIEKGKVSMDLRYKLRDGKLKADNHLVFDQLTLGERVESPDATSLPVDLAVALLKDGNGRFDLDLPIHGDLKDPQVSLGSLLSAAARQFLSNLVAAPLSLLGSLAADGGEALDAVHFAPGSEELAPHEQGKLRKVSKILRERPGLNLEIKGTSDPEADRQALASRALDRRIAEIRRAKLRSAGKPATDVDSTAIPPEEYQRLLAELLGRPTEKGFRVLPAVSDRESAKHRWLQSWPVDELDLRRLAQARAQAVRSFLVQNTDVSDGRIYLLDVRLETPPGGGQIETLLALRGS